MELDDFRLAGENHMGNRGIKKPSIFLKKTIDKSQRVCYNIIRKNKGEQTMIIRNIANCPFTPDTINDKKVRKIIFKKFAICY